MTSSLQSNCSGCDSMINLEASGSLVERERHLPGEHSFPADLNFQISAELSILGRDIGEADILFHIGRVGTAGDASPTLAFGPDGIAVARNATLDHLKTHQLFPQSLLLLSHQRIPSDKGTFFEVTDPSQIRLKQCGLSIQFMPVKWVSSFESQGIACPKAGWNQAFRLSGIEQRSPDLFRLRRRKIKFKPVFAGIACACQQDIHPATPRGAAPIVLQLRELCVCYFAEYRRRSRSLKGQL